MSRSGYTDDCENVWLYRQAVARACGGKRGQTMLRDMVEALDAMPVHELASVTFDDGAKCCALGAVARARGVTGLHDDSEPDTIGDALDIAQSLAAEVMDANDDDFGVHNDGFGETDAERWVRMRAWAVGNLTIPGTETPSAELPAAPGWEL